MGVEYNRQSYDAKAGFDVLRIQGINFLFTEAFYPVERAYVWDSCYFVPGVFRFFLRLFYRRFV